MKKKDLDELKLKSTSELAKKITELKKTTVNIQIETKMAKTKNVHELKKLKKEIAQTMTIKKIKEMAQNMKKEKKAQGAAN